MADLTITLETFVTEQPPVNRRVGTLAERGALAGGLLFEGLEFYATDADVEAVYDGTAWVERPLDFRIVADRTARNALRLRKQGLIAKVMSEGGALYHLVGGTTDADWRPLQSPRNQYVGRGALAEVFIDPDAGNDVTGDGTEALPYATSARAALDFPDRIERDLELVLKAGTHGTDPFDGPGVYFHAGGCAFEGVDCANGTRGSIRMRGEVGDIDESVTTVGAEVVVGEEVCTDVDIGVDISAAFAAADTGSVFIEWDFLGAKSYYPIVSVTGTVVRVVSDPFFWTPDGGDEVRVISLATTVLSLDLVASRVGYGDNGGIVSALRLGAGFHALDGYSLRGIAHDDGQAVIKRSSISGYSANTAGFPGSTASNAYISDSSIDTVNFTSTGEWQLSGIISPFMVIRHRQAIDHKFHARHAEIQEITDYPSSFNGAGIVFDLEQCFMESRAAYAVGATQTTLFRLLDTLVKAGGSGSHDGVLTGPIVTLLRGGHVKGINTLLSGLTGSHDVRDEDGVNYARGAAPVGILNLLAGFSA
jgi:hypothetical protein